MGCKWPLNSIDDAGGDPLARRIALIGCAYLHLVLAVGVYYYKPSFKPLAQRPPVRIVYEPQKFKEQFIEVTENTADKPPARADYYAAYNQVAAQERLTPHAKGLNPLMEGKDPDSIKLTRSRDACSSSEPIAGPSSESLRQQTETLARSAPVLAQPDITEKPKTVAADGICAPESPKVKRAEIESAQRVVPLDQASAQAHNMNPAQAKPLPRPRVSSESICSSATKKGDGSQAPLGRLAVNARFSHFGAYSQQMFAIISQQWYALLAKMANSLVHDSGHTVHTTFDLCSTGAIENFKVVFSNASDPGTFVCRQAILGSVPFLAWSPEMQAIFGERTTVELTFQYY